MRICRRIHKLTNSVYCKAGIQSKKGRYWTSPTIWRNCVGLENKWSDIMVILEVEIGVSTSLQEVIPAQVRISMIYDAVRCAIFGSHGRRTIRCWRAAGRGGEDSNLGSEGRCNSKEESVLVVVTDLEIFNSKWGEPTSIAGGKMGRRVLTAEGSDTN